ncbi:hypothetical protein D3C80_2053040 [compost metagenome]
MITHAIDPYNFRAFGASGGDGGCKGDGRAAEHEALPRAAGIAGTQYFGHGFAMRSLDYVPIKDRR